MALVRCETPAFPTIRHHTQEIRNFFRTDLYLVLYQLIVKELAHLSNGLNSVYPVSSTYDHACIINNHINMNISFISGKQMFYRLNR